MKVASDAMNILFYFRHAYCSQDIDPQICLEYTYMKCDYFLHTAQFANPVNIYYCYITHCSVDHHVRFCCIYYHCALWDGKLWLSRETWSCL